MKKILLSGHLFLALSVVGLSQSVFDPNDTIMRHDPSQPYGSTHNPDTNRLGLQKWVSTPTLSVSYGIGSFDHTAFKQYFINTGNVKMAFRIKFPKSYKNPDSAGKKYPVNIALHGGPGVGCPNNGGIYNNERPLVGGATFFAAAVDQNKFDGFLVYPQLTLQSGCSMSWGIAPARHYLGMLSMIDSMVKYARADIDRLLITGLSGGGYGAWKFMESYPQRVAKIMPSASHRINYRNSPAAFVHIPVWFATGGRDLDPSPAQAAGTLETIKNAGADIRYTQYPERGHDVWNQHWGEPDFIDEMNDMHKANPLVFFQRTRFCRGAPVDAKLGITQGFYAYEWQKDGVSIATATAGVLMVLDNATVASYTVGNEVSVKAFGTYRVRFKRSINSAWSDWSLKPAVIYETESAQSADIQINGKRSRVLPAPDGSTTVPLIQANSFMNYTWYQGGDSIAAGQIYYAAAGTYQARYNEEFGCPSLLSDPFTVIDANGTPKPDPATSLVAAPVSESVAKISWTGGGGETGYEIYRATASGGPYTFVGITAPDVSTYNDSGLTRNANYHYIVRAVSEIGAAAPSNETSIKTLIDKTPPTAPTNLQYSETAQGSVRLGWNAATDNVSVARYDIYVNGKKLISTPDTVFTVSNLDSLIPYRFIVRAVDSVENVSPSSNQVTYLPPGTPASTIPATPASLQAEATTFNVITVSWSDTLSNETGFEIVRSASADGPFVTVGTIASNSTSFRDSGLTASTTYFYQVRAIGKYGESDYSEAVSAATPALPATPVAPSQLSGEPGTTNSITISWTDNSDNETGFVVYRSTDNVNFSAIANLTENANAYTDNGVNNQTIYYYSVAGVNLAGEGGKSNAAIIKAGNRPPFIGGLNDIVVRALQKAIVDFQIRDDAGDTLKVTVTNKPAFVKIENLNSGNYRLTATPGQQDIGIHIITITAIDNHGKSISDQVTITVGDNNTKTVYVNFGHPAKPSPAPWNNWIGVLAANGSITGLKDEANVTTPITLTSVDGWSAIQTMGHITGDNSGVFPDAVLESGLMDASTAPRRIKISGLNTAKLYNIIIVGSRNEGYQANASITANGQTVVSDARNNTDRTVNLNGLQPDANGQILLSFVKNSPAIAVFLNGIAIEEINPSMSLLAPNHLYGTAANQTTIKLSWSDRAANEAAADGYELQRASDSGFTANVRVISLPANTTTYTDTGLQADREYWYRVRAKNASAYSEYSRKLKTVTASTIVYVKLNATSDYAPAPWNNLQPAPTFLFTEKNLKDQSGNSTNISLKLTKEFNGVNTAGASTGDNSGVVPDKVLMGSYWLDNLQVGQFRLTGLNHTKTYRIGFIGSSDVPLWTIGNYTAAYTVNRKTVYLNAWKNSTKIVYINDLTPDASGNMLLDFSTSAAAQYGFNSGFIVEEYRSPAIPVPVDTIPSDTTARPPNPPNPPNPPGSGGDTTEPEPPNPPNPPDPAGPGGDTTEPQPPNPPDPPGSGGDTTEPEPPLVKIYPNPMRSGVFSLNFYNQQATDVIEVRIYDAIGNIKFRRNYGSRPPGGLTLTISANEAGMRSGMYAVVLIVNGKLVKTIKLFKHPN